MAFDPWLYAAFGAGLLLGVVVRPRTPWVGRAMVATVLVLVGFLGASLAVLAPVQLLGVLPYAFLFVALILGATLGLFALVRRSLRREDVGAPSAPGSPDRVPLSLVLLASLVGGYALGRTVSLPVATGLTWALYALLFLVALGIQLRREGLRDLWIPVLCAVGGAAIAGLGFALLVDVPVPAALATAFAFGWYSLAGPLVADRAGALLGLLAFLTNYLREDLTMLLSPLIGRRVGGEGLSAMGGATSMDTTLYFITRYGGSRWGSLALATGLILTLLASLILPAALALP